MRAARRAATGGSRRQRGRAAAHMPPRRPVATAAADVASAAGLRCELSSLPLGELAKRTAVVLAVVVAFAAGVWLFLEVRQIILWLVIAVVLAMALEPAVAWLTRHRLKRGLAAVLVSLAAIVVARRRRSPCWPCRLSTRPVSSSTTCPATSTTSPSRAARSPASRPVPHRRATSRRSRPKALTLLAGAGTPALQALRTTFTVLAAIVSILTMTVLLLIEGPRTWEWTLSLLAAERRPVAHDLGSHLLSSVGGYVRGNLLISLIAGVAAYVAMLIVGVPFALPLAVAVAVLDLIPLVGATLGAIVCVDRGAAPAAAGCRRSSSPSTSSSTSRSRTT